MVKLDFFKRINDEFGQAADDQMLLHITSLIRSLLRKSDALVRYGSEEFTLILPDPDSRGIMRVSMRLRQVMQKLPLMFEDNEIKTALSGGVASLAQDENGHALLRRADEALHKAKQSGRNKSLLAT